MALTKTTDLSRACLVPLLLVALCGSSCSKNIDDMESGQVDFSNPKRVLSSVFYAAKEGKSDHLASLCDPTGKANQHAQRICAVTVGSADWAEFVRQFAKAKLIGEARVSGDSALVNFVFGESGTNSETMELVQRDGRWYLLSF